MAAITTADVKVDGAKLAEELSTPENPVTKRAVEQQWTKLKKIASEGGV